MALKKLSYIEYEGEARQWTLKPLDFGTSNLVVGKNATGKSRLINVTTSLMMILTGRRTAENSGAGHYYAEFLINGIKYVYELATKQKAVLLERLSVNGEPRLERDASGEGKVYYEKEGKFLDFSMEATAIAFQGRKDRLQHPFIVELADWAEASATYAFGGEFGKLTFMMESSVQTQSNGQSSGGDEPNNPLKTYLDGWRQFGEPFDEAIVEDMRALGFPVTAVHAEQLDSTILSPAPQASLIALALVEEGVTDHVTQLTMSQGMYRALALTIKLNWATFTGKRGLILIDDLGEGLDYERSCKAIELTMQKAEQGGAQVIVTSNDRFVMNAVPLESWVALKRDGSTVEGFTARNSPEAFKNFRYTGLSNFDFFTSQSFH
ncbi:AAA family ATPase [Rhodoferax fermentans]|uniref:ATPase AAA-type core domain-containing protein n=1 Tax=Rhodoferax fermentans TaxID=28066 RepID=A0A1T1AQD1_RHOFE|nr:AAA family ATPase [Rhodoferax fermentans]MBK1683566.1 ATP-binding protein [Rhodoferax fermentans]OOV06311.1 hypothetical protein RF819_05830 [Rhodoferax fermentans]